MRCMPSPLEAETSRAACALKGSGSLRGGQVSRLAATFGDGEARGMSMTSPLPIQAHSPLPLVRVRVTNSQDHEVTNWTTDKNSDARQTSFCNLVVTQLVEYRENASKGNKYTEEGKRDLIVNYNAWVAAGKPPPN